MKRALLTDGSGSWFNLETAIQFVEDTRFDGRNQISVPTGSQWHHECLYYTRSGKWVLNEFSNYQGSLESYVQIDESDAIAWLIRNSKFDCLDTLPPAIQTAVQSGIQSAEI